MSRSWLILVALGIVAVLTGPSVRALGSEPHIKSSLITFAQPTYVGGHLLVGDYMIVHDEDKMNAGQPCTTIYRSTWNRAEQIVSFHCVPRPRVAVDHFVVRVAPDDRKPGKGFQRLVEYQFAGDAEGHGVP